MAILSLDGARPFVVNGWRNRVDRETRLLAEWTDTGEFALSQPTWLSRSEILREPLDVLSFDTDSQQLTSGAFSASVLPFGRRPVIGPINRILNRVGTHRDTFAILRVDIHRDNGLRRRIVLGWERLTETELRTHLADALPQWAQAYVDTVTRRITTGKLTAQPITNLRFRWKNSVHRGVLTPEHHEKLLLLTSPDQHPPDRTVPNRANHATRIDQNIEHDR